jgi:antirestriction protein ArdC
MNLFQTVSETILAKLSEGVIPWRKTWAAGLPCSVGSGKEYRGINIILLGLQDHTSRYWVTYKEAKRLEGYVTKGAKGSRVIYWHWRTPEERQRLIDSGKATSPAPCTPFLSTVFNLEQTEGLKAPGDDLNCLRKGRLDKAEEFLKNLPAGPEVLHSTHYAPCYMPLADAVQLPHLSQFDSAEHYYSTMFHELVHSTGHPSRLNRELGSSKGVKAYSFEELVAEIGAAFLCALTGIDNQRTISEHAAYIKGWKEFLSEDPGCFMRAATEAQKAVDYLRGVSFSSNDAARTAPDTGGD